MAENMRTSLRAFAFLVAFSLSACPTSDFQGVCVDRCEQALRCKLESVKNEAELAVCRARCQSQATERARLIAGGVLPQSCASAQVDLDACLARLSCERIRAGRTDECASQEEEEERRCGFLQ